MSGRKFRRRTLKQWAKFIGVRRKRGYRWNAALHRYEDEVVLGDIEAHPGDWVTAFDLRLHHPGRYTDDLDTVLRRLHKSGRLKRQSVTFLSRWAYQPRERRREGRGDRRAA